jgi:exonuclease VII small subunit
MKPLSDAWKIVTQEDLELAKKPAAWTPEQNDLDSASLMGLLGDIDGLKNEIHERMRRIEAVKQAKSVLQEDAERTEALNKRLAEIGKAMNVAHAGVHASEAENENAEPVRIPSRTNLAETELRNPSARILSEGAALPWPRTEEFQDSPGDAQLRQEFTEAYESASRRLEEAEQFWQRGDQAAREGQQRIDQSTAQLLLARKAEETAAADLLSARQELTTAYQFAAVAAQRRLDAVESFQRSARWAIFAVTLSWIAMSWMAWFAFSTKVPVWAPAAMTVILVVLAVTVTKRIALDA